MTDTRITSVGTQVEIDPRRGDRFTAEYVQVETSVYEERRFTHHHLMVEIQVVAPPSIAFGPVLQVIT